MDEITEIQNDSKSIIGYTVEDIYATVWDIRTACVKVSHSLFHCVF